MEVPPKRRLTDRGGHNAISYRGDFAYRGGTDTMETRLVDLQSGPVPGLTQGTTSQTSVCCDFVTRWSEYYEGHSDFDDAQDACHGGSAAS